MPTVVLRRFGGVVITAEGVIVARARCEFDDGLFCIFLNVPPYVNEDFVAACKRACYVPATMRGVLEGWIHTFPDPAKRPMLVIKAGPTAAPSAPCTAPVRLKGRTFLNGSVS